MCGICGTVRFDGRPVEVQSFQRACATLHHRGPDHTGIWVDAHGTQSIGLGVTRLAVLDPAPTGHQPMERNAGRFHLAFNGEIYNYRALRQVLIDHGESFLTDGDTEVVLAACARWGVDALPRFNGMWALAFYDSSTKTGFLSRDRFGIKPLFYNASRAGLSFASELRALSTLESPGDIDPQALTQHLVFGYIAHPATIFQQSRRLEPAHYMKFDASSAGPPVCYYDPANFNQEEKGLDYGAVCADVRRALTNSVVARRVSDVPIGAFLSGGLDSSIIVAHLAEATGRPVRTFSVGYAGQGTYDETDFARVAAQRFGSDHLELVLTERDVLDAIPRILDHLGEPVGDSSIVPTSLISQFAAQHVTVALSGDGGDELFGGYWRYLGHDVLAAYRRIPAPLRRFVVEPTMAALASAKSSVWGNRIRQFRKLLRAQSADPTARHVAWSRILAPDAETLFRDSRNAGNCNERMCRLAQTLTEDRHDGDTLNRILDFDLRYQLPADMLQKVDLASMMHSLEVRVPFLDHRVVELASSLPSHYKIGRGVRKRVLTDAYRGRLPDRVLDRAKQGFELPIGEYLRGPLREVFHDTVTREVVDSFGILSYDGVKSIYEAHLNRREEHADVLFALLSLCWWQCGRQRSGSPA